MEDELLRAVVVGAVGAAVTAVVGLIAAWSRQAIERRDERRVMKDRVELAAARVALISDWIAASTRLGDDFVSAQEMAHARDELRAAFDEAKAAVRAEESVVTPETAAAGIKVSTTHPAGRIRRLLLLERREQPASYAVVAAFYFVVVYGWIVGLTIESGNSVLQRAGVATFWTVVGFTVVGMVVRRLDLRGGATDALRAPGEPLPPPL